MVGGLAQWVLVETPVLVAYIVCLHPDVVDIGKPLWIRVTNEDETIGTIMVRQRRGVQRTVWGIA